MRFAVLRFHGSNCDQDCYHVIDQVMQQPVEYVFQDAEDLSDYDCVVIPGGFSFGDYLRAGAMAAHTPVMDAVRTHAQEGGLVLGICNGFQILCEAGLLSGALMINDHLRFACHDVHVRIEDVQTPFTCAATPGQVLRLSIAYHQGNYQPDPQAPPVRVVLRYVTPGGVLDPTANPNGAWESVAGIANERGNVVAMMPHPERASEMALGGQDGRLVFASILQWWRQEEDGRV